jgi:CHRD domain
MLTKRFVLATIGLMLSVPALTGVASAGDTRVLVAHLDGGNELPGPGDPDAFGSATVTLVTATSLCAMITVQNLGAAATAAHIHTGDAGVAGGVFVPLAVNGTVPFRIASCVVGLPAATITALRSNPAGFYVNVHTAAFAGGAVRGQLQSE